VVYLKACGNRPAGQARLPAEAAGFQERQ